MNCKEISDLSQMFGNMLYKLRMTNHTDFTKKMLYPHYPFTVLWFIHFWENSTRHRSISKNESQTFKKQPAGCRLRPLWAAASSFSPNRRLVQSSCECITPDHTHSVYRWQHLCLIMCWLVSYLVCPEKPMDGWRFLCVCVFHEKKNDLKAFCPLGCSLSTN